MGLDGKTVKRYLGWALDTTRDSHLRTLNEVALFRGMGRKLLRKLLVDLVEKRYAPGDVIFHEGETGKVLYVVLEGSVRITKRSHTEEKTLAVLGPGCHFGELALINQCARFATAVAEKESLLLIMYKSYFDDLTRVNSTISLRILHNLAEILSAYIQAGLPEGPAEETSS